MKKQSLKILNGKDRVWVTSTKAEMQALACTGIKGIAIYTQQEIRELKRMDEKMRKAIHYTKNAFPGCYLVRATPPETQLKHKGENMKLSEMFPGTYLKKEDVANPKILTIAEVTIEEIENEDGKTTKPILYFEEKDVRPLVLNKTVATTLEENFGLDSDDWAGNKIELF